MSLTIDNIVDASACMTLLLTGYFCDWQ